MTPRPRISRIKSKSDIAAKLGISMGTFNARRAQMEAEGFPEYDRLLGGYDVKAVDLWLDRRSNIAPASITAADRALVQWEQSEQSRAS